MASTSGNAKDIQALRDELESTKRKVLMQDINIAALLKKNQIIEASLEAAGIEIVALGESAPADTTAPESTEATEDVNTPESGEPASEENTPPEDFPGAYDEIEDREELFAIATERGLEPHSQLGVKKLRALLEEDDAKNANGPEEE